MTEACNGNCWTCVDVAAQIIKAIRENHPGAEDAALCKNVQGNVLVCCFIRHKGGQAYMRSERRLECSGHNFEGRKPILPPPLERPIANARSCPSR
jgi:hypothetical protein